MISAKYKFYLHLFFAFFSKNFLANKIYLLPKKISKISSTRKIKIHFYAPLNASGKNTAGARVVIIDVIPELKKIIRSLDLPWAVTFSNNYPKTNVDYLICFKAVPPKNIIGRPKIFLSICDEGENFWDYLDKYDALIASSSMEFAKLISIKNKKTFFISEAESINSINFGFKNIKNKLPSQRPCNLMWHGLNISYTALLDLKPHLIRLAKSYKVNLIIVRGKEPKYNYNWGGMNVTHFPWSIKNMRKCAEMSQLGIIPSRGTLRTSYLKPASRIRALYALGVPSIGDASIPNVVNFVSRINGPTADSPKEFINQIKKFLQNPEQLDVLALKGLELLKHSFNNRIAAIQWLNLFLSYEKKQMKYMRNRIRTLY
jgi:hypothetical protein